VPGSVEADHGPCAGGDPAGKSGVWLSFATNPRPVFTRPRGRVVPKQLCGDSGGVTGLRGPRPSVGNRRAASDAAPSSPEKEKTRFQGDGDPAFVIGTAGTMERASGRSGTTGACLETGKRERNLLAPVFGGAGSSRVEPAPLAEVGLPDDSATPEGPGSTSISPAAGDFSGIRARSPLPDARGPVARRAGRGSSPPWGGTETGRGGDRHPDTLVGKSPRAAALPSPRIDRLFRKEGQGPSWWATAWNPPPDGRGHAAAAPDLETRGRWCLSGGTTAEEAERWKGGPGPEGGIFGEGGDALGGSS